MAGRRRVGRRALVAGDGAAGRGVAPTRSTRSTWPTPSTPLLPDDAILTADSGSAANWYARHLRMRGGMRGSLSGTLATMGRGVPYAIGAKFAHPDRPGVALVGDGAMQMNGMAELITAAKYWRRVGRSAAGRRPSATTRTSTRSPGRCGRWPARPSSCRRRQLPDVRYAEFAARSG